MREQFSIIELPESVKFVNRYAIAMSRDQDTVKTLIGTALTQTEALLILKWLQSVSEFDLAEVHRYADNDKYEDDD